MPQNKLLISSKFTGFYKKWLYLVFLVSLAYFLFPPHIRNIPKDLQWPFSVLLIIFVVGSCYRAFNNISVVHIDDDFLYVDDFKSTYNIDLKKVTNVWQEETFLSRKIHISFFNDEKHELEIRFIGHFETNLKGKHHPVIDVIQERIKASANPK